MKKIFWHITIITLVMISTALLSIDEYRGASTIGSLSFIVMLGGQSLRDKLNKKEQKFDKKQRKHLTILTIITYVALTSLHIVSVSFADLVNVKSFLLLLTVVAYFWLIYRYVDILIGEKSSYKIDSSAEIDEDLLMK